MHARLSSREELYSSECQDKVSLAQGNTATTLDDARSKVAFRIAVRAFTGLNIANGVTPKEARTDAENALSKLRKEKS